MNYGILSKFGIGAIIAASIALWIWVVWVILAILAHFGIVLW